jgi:hypothetical protein
MQVSREAREKIEAAFQKRGGVRGFTTFGRVTEAQQQCIDLLMRKRDAIFSTTGRDAYLRDLIMAITGTEETDDGESITEANFSQYHFYKLYIHELVFFPEKFDYLLRCIEEKVCVVQFPQKFIGVLDRVLEAVQAVPVPDHVRNYEQLLAKDEEMRIESFTLRKDWKCQVPHYLDDLKPSSGALD